MSGSRGVAVLGPIPRDRITTHNGEVFEKYGCALYTVAALAALLDDDDRILPIVHVRARGRGADQGAAVGVPERGPHRHPLGVRPRRGRRAHLHRPGQPDRAADGVHGPDHAGGRRVRAARRGVRLRADHRLRGRPGHAGLHQVPQRRHGPARRPRPHQHAGDRRRAQAPAVGRARLVAAARRRPQDEPGGGRLQLVPVAGRARATTTRATPSPRSSCPTSPSTACGTGSRPCASRSTSAAAWPTSSTTPAPSSRRSVPRIVVENVVDATGAGDSFAAGMAFGFMQSHDIVAAARYGNAMGAQRVQRARGSTSTARSPRPTSRSPPR